MLTKSDLTAIRTIVKEEVTEQTKHLATKDELNNFKGEILKEIESLREDNVILSSHSDKLEDHENRISVLEKSTVSHPG